MNKKENYIKISLDKLHSIRVWSSRYSRDNNTRILCKISLDKLHSIRVLLSRLYRDDPFLHKDIELLLFYIYQDKIEIDEIIKKWKEETRVK